ncbi:MAG TPA: LuxR family transcriptional regulator, partial [Roseiflexaceae bacterium]
MLATSPQTIRISADAQRDPLLFTKLTPPSIRANPIARPRLTDALAHGARGPLTLISAPAGYGKTTLLSAWARQGAAPLAWLSLDRNDNDPLHFWAYLIAALRTVNPDCGAAALALIGSPQPPPTTTALTLLLNDLATCASSCVLVLDDYHLIDNPAIHQALGFVLEHRPPNLHLILAGRSVPALPLARLRARGQLVELRAADLRCTRAEATIFLSDHMQLTLPPDALAMLASRTEGWLAGLHLAALAVQGAADGLGVVHALSGTQQMIRDYLIDEVFDQQPHAIQQFLLQTAILERLNARLCDALRNGSAPARSSDS